MKVDITGKSVNWLQVKLIQCRRNAADSIFLNYTFDESHFIEVHIRSTRKREIKAKLQEPTPLYTNKLLISQAKKADLMSLCASGIIPSKFHKYSVTAMARTRIARLPWMTKTSFLSP